MLLLKIILVIIVLDLMTLALTKFSTADGMERLQHQWATASNWDGSVDPSAGTGDVIIPTGAINLSNRFNNTGLYNWYWKTDDHRTGSKSHSR